MIRSLVVILLLCCTTLVRGDETPQAEEVRYVMGTTATVQAWAADSAAASLAIEVAYAAFDRTDSLMSAWRNDSILNRLNQAKAGQWVVVGPEVCGVLQEAKAVAEARQSKAYLAYVAASERLDAAVTEYQEISHELEAEGFQILNDVVFNQVLVTCDNDELTRQTLHHIQQSGECWVGGAAWDGKAVIRISVCSWATTEKDITRSVRAFIAARNKAIQDFENT